MTNKEYRAHSGISRSDLFKIAKSPLHFKYAMENPKEKTPALVFGSMVHKLVLEPETFYDEYVVAPSIDRRTKEGKAAWNEFVESVGDREVIDLESFNEASKMAAAVNSNKYCKLLLSGEKEQSFFWVDEATGEECKCRPDALATIGGQKIIVDYKSTEDAETQAFIRSAIKYGYDLQVGMYTEGVQSSRPGEYLFVFIAQEKKPPYAINIVQADDIFCKEGKRLYHDLLDIYHECKVTDNWYGYEGAENQIGVLSLPAWLAKSVELED